MRTITLIILTLFIQLNVFSQSSIELFANYETIGINVNLDVNDPEKDAYGTVEYKKTNLNQWNEALPLSRVENDLEMCSGSIFWLNQGTSYDVKVTLIDPTTQLVNGQVLEASMTTKTDPVFTSSGQTYLVNPEGNNNTYTLQEALNIAQTGDKVLLGSGTYYVGHLTLPNNGTATQPILIVGEENSEVILNGAYETPLVWTPFGNSGVYKTTTPVKNPNLIIADGERLFPHQTYTDLVNNQITATLTNIEPAGMSGFYRNPTKLPLWPTFGDPGSLEKNDLYIKFLDNADPNTKNMEITKQEWAINLENNSFITLKNLTFKNYGVGSTASAIVITDSEEIIIDSCIFQGNNTSVHLAGNSRNITIQNSLFEDYFVNWTAWKIKATHDIAPFNQRFPGNSRNMERGSIICNPNFYGKGITIRGNLFQNYHQSGRLTPTPPNGSVLDDMKTTLEIDLYNNIVRYSGGDGFEIDNYARNIRIFNNRFETCGSPLSLAPAAEGSVYIFNNVFFDLIEDFYISNFTILSTKGHPIKFQTAQEFKNGDIFFYHNTVDAQNIAYGMNIAHTSSEMPWKKLDLKNNIFVTDEGTALNIRTLSSPQLESDYNAYFSENPNIACVNLDNSSPIYFTSIEELAANYNWEENSIQTDPQFKNQNEGDYRLSASSPLIDFALVIPGVNDMNYNGLGPDLGAFEYGTNTGTEEITTVEKIKVFPNPTTNKIFLKNNPISNATYSMLDMNGKVVKTGLVIKEENFEINLDDLPNGMYFVKLLLEEDTNIQIMKVVKMN